MRRYIWLGLVLLSASSAQAHEFWIAPEAYRIETDASLVADVRVGQMMEGQSYPYLSHKIVSYTVTDRRGVSPVEANEGDIPSLVRNAATPGLNIVAYDAKAEQLTYDTMAEFSEYLEEEGLGHIIARHVERGLPESGFTEAYTRNAKSLIQVGPVEAADEDRATGLRFELVARKNPYSVALVSLPVNLLWLGEPAANTQISIFRKPATGKVVRTTVLTDARGKAEIPLAGGGQFLLGAVHMEEVAEETGAVWLSTWASLTFGLPEQNQ